MPAPDRRQVLRGIAVGGLALPLLAACGTGMQPPGAAPGGGSGGKAKGGTLGPVSTIPVGGGRIFSAQQVVVTQPTKGTIHGFSAICTHMGCLVAEVTQGVIICPCHGSAFSIKNGAVVGGPAPSPLPARSVTVAGGQVKLA